MSDAAGCGVCLSDVLPWQGQTVMAALQFTAWGTPLFERQQDDQMAGAWCVKQRHQVHVTVCACSAWYALHACMAYGLPTRLG